MRFILKSAFWLGLVAFFLPFGGEPKETTANVDAFSLFVGVQQAIADVTGFCDRAPQACETGREVAIFAGERIGDGIEMAYGLVEGRIGEPASTDIAATPAAAGSPTDPIATGTVGVSETALALPTGYTPPRRDALAAAPLALYPGSAKQARLFQVTAEPVSTATASTAAPEAPTGSLMAPAFPVPTPAPRA